MDHNLTVFDSLSPLSSASFSAVAGTCFFCEKAGKHSGEFSSFKSLIFPSGAGGDQNRVKRRVNIGLTFARWPEK